MLPLYLLHHTVPARRHQAAQTARVAGQTALDEQTLARIRSYYRGAVDKAYDEAAADRHGVDQIGDDPTWNAV